MVDIQCCPMLIRNCGFRLLRCDTEFFAVCGNIDGIDDVSACSDDDDNITGDGSGLTGDECDLFDSVLNFTCCGILYFIDNRLALVG